MCGIAAIFAYHKDAPPVDQAELLRVREHMQSRGPDGSGLWLSPDGRIGLAHRRLSIIDLSEAGAQPMIDPDTGNVIVFNGEIYNYRELRRDLEVKGYRFRSSSDTEVLLKLYAAKGPDMLHDLRGMYAFAIYTPDSDKIVNRKPYTVYQGCPSLFLARDPYGIKPLYIHDDGKTLRLASQVKALLAGGNIPKEPEPAGHAGFFLWGHIPEPFTFYKNIRAFEPGTTLWIDCHGKRERKQFCSITEELAKASKFNTKISDDDARKTLRSSLLDTVRAHLVADVPVGIFLSSGLDSTTLVALAAEVGADLRTVTLGFDEYRGTPDDEVPLAETVAKQYGAQHQTVWVTRDEFRQEYDNLLHAMDQPTTDGVNTYLVSMAARKAGLKVALSGLGGDELFGGYPSFHQIPKSVRAFGWARHTPWLGKAFRNVAAHLAPYTSNHISPKYAGILEYGGTYGGAYLLRRALYMPWELSQIMDPDMAQTGLRELQTMSRLKETEKGIPVAHGKVSALETTWYMCNQLLRDTDWASMAHSLEIRVPLVDRQLLCTTAPISGKFGMPGKKAMAGTPAQPLPDVVLNRPKSGFGVPTREWLLPQGASKGAGSRQWAREVYGGFSNSRAIA
ncbi:MAG: asparagine synthase (glutamine-hydrolyzing) [Desulforudis sp.]|jgi:asparagine synthase (glutamine-hydrolysing)|nr:MAG: asparagine synthase (glutamine-hydrolyzing) [Desulforudis sp.]